MPTKEALPLGCQTYPVRAMIEQDFPGTIKKLADAGYKEIELCSPVGYAAEGFGGLSKYTGAEIRQIFSDLGLFCQGSHFFLQELRDDLSGRAEWARGAGISKAFIPTFAGPSNPTFDHVKRLADEFNEMGRKAADLGLELGLHNEEFEMTSIDGERTYDVLLKLLDPKLIKFQFQILTVSRGFDPVDYFNRYPGRFTSMHVQDWSTAQKKTVAVGGGNLDWMQIFKAAKASGVKSYFVELGLEDMQQSAAYLKSLALVA